MDTVNPQYRIWIKVVNDTGADITRALEDGTTEELPEIKLDLTPAKAYEVRDSLNEALQGYEAWAEEQLNSQPPASNTESGGVPVQV